VTKIAVLGGGSWGTALANLLAGQENLKVWMWVREPQLTELIQKTGQNSWYLPGIILDSSLKVSSDLEEVVQGATYYLIAVPCQYVRSILAKAKNLVEAKAVFICASKGIEISSLKPMSEVIAEVLVNKNPIYAVLSGPSFAKEVAQKLPTAVSLACIDLKIGQKLQALFSTSYFRVYLNQDVRGVELGGALKNVIALATGICDGLGFGYNARAGLITRGLAEMSRLGMALGAKEKTFMGLSGMGDLVLTCTGDLSRNRQVGLRLGKGESLEQITTSMRMVAEGVKTTQAVYALAQKLNIEMPITEQVYKILYQQKDPKTAVMELMTRTLKLE